MKRKKGMYALTIMTLAASLLTACSGGKSEPEVGGNAAAPAPSNEPVELSFWLYVGSITDNERFMNAFGDKIKEKFPNVTPKFIAPGKGVNLKSLIESQQPIDIIYDAYGQLHQNLLEYGMQYDISELLKTYKYDLSKLEPTSVAAMQELAKGGMYGLPVSVDSVNILYNKGLFDRFGVPYPTDNMSWEEMYDLTKKLARVENGVRYMGLGMSPMHVTIADQTGPEFIDAAKSQGLLSSDTFKKMFKTLTDFYMIANNHVDNTSWNYSSMQLDLFKKQQIAMLLTVSATGPRIIADNVPGLEWDVAAYPHYKEMKTVGPQLNPGYFLVPVTSKHKDMAFQVAAYVTSDEFQKHLARKGYSPILKDPAVWAEYGKDLPFMQGKNVKAMIPDNSAPIVPATPFHAIAKNELPTIIQDYLLNGKDMNTTLREADDRINQKITEKMAQSK
ncbi:extracellular solute-binding protein [Paenibacillus hemerocallicola]|uniref:Extracellular solute-binding protein n=1 Tax=Paenibacillus hemerocallicola TaxID=1172614 RepID=A0A5C4SZ65_9BACL|nr:extracellular solute-binding protein [Paenibacillus hemerocallicola]TNJ62118.1 extracellular solute-binding protein [Paenibacillus hemerocallicola]